MYPNHSTPTHPMPSDALKMEDFSKFDNIYKKYYKPCYAYARSYVLDDAEAQDIATESMIKLWQRYKTEKTTDNITSYLFTIVKNAALDVLRQRKIKQEHLCDYTAWQIREIEINTESLSQSSHDSIFGQEIDRILSETLEALPEQTRRVFSLSRFERMTNRQIAQDLGISVKTVEYHITRTLKVLRVNLKDYLLVYILLKINL